MTVLSLYDIHKSFGPTVALDGVSLQLQRGDVHALLGENGAEKSTLMNVLAGLLHQDADVLLLDEPTRGIDIGSKAQVYQTIAECAANGKAILMVSSYFPELFGMCDRLAVMSRGRLSAPRPIDDWTPQIGNAGSDWR